LSEIKRQLMIASQPVRTVYRVLKASLALAVFVGGADIATRLAYTPAAVQAKVEAAARRAAPVALDTAVVEPTRLGGFFTNNVSN
jgi:hypothetical protein